MPRHFKSVMKVTGLIVLASPLFILGYLGLTHEGAPSAAKAHIHAPAPESSASSLRVPEPSDAPATEKLEDQWPVRREPAPSSQKEYSATTIIVFYDRDLDVATYRTPDGALNHNADFGAHEKEVNRYWLRMTPERQAAIDRKRKRMWATLTTSLASALAEWLDELPEDAKASAVVDERNVKSPRGELPVPIRAENLLLHAWDTIRPDETPRSLCCLDPWRPDYAKNGLGSWGG